VEALEERCLMSGATPPVSTPQNLTNVSGTLFFTVTDSSGDLELWKSTGTSAQTTLIDTWGAASSHTATPPGLTNVNGVLFFAGFDSSDGTELWKSDGTAAGTVMVADINPGAASSDPSVLTNVGGTLFFQADDGVHGRELWRSDGTASGTEMVADLVPGSGSSDAIPMNVAGKLFVNAQTGSNGAQLWESDGTAAGTTLISPYAADEAVSLSGEVYLVAAGRVWKTNGTRAGTSVVTGNDVFYSGPEGLTNLNGTLYFAADGFDVSANSARADLWKTDGTWQGTVPVADVFPGSSYLPSDLTNVNGTLTFLSGDGTHGQQIWQSDGTSAGTVMVTDLPGGVTAFADENGTLLAFSPDPRYGLSLWSINGALQDATLISVLDSATGGANSPFAAASNVTEAGNRLFFTVVNSSSQGAFWTSDGTTPGTSTLDSYAVPPSSGVFSNNPLPPAQRVFTTQLMASAGVGASLNLYVVDAQKELYTYAPSSGWQKIGGAGTITAVTATQDATGRAVAFVLTTDDSLFEYDSMNGWRKLGAMGTISGLSAGRDSDGAADVYVATTAGALTEYRGSSGWLATPIGAAGTFGAFVAVGGGRVIVDTTNGNFAEYGPKTGWFALNGTAPASIMSLSAVTDVSGQDVVYALTTSGALWRHDSSGWRQFGASGTIEGISAGLDVTGQAVVFAATAGNGLAKLSASGWSSLNPPKAPVELSASIADKVFMVLSDGSVYGHDDQSGFFPFSSPGFAF
jgi:ELWxxDGT repeat protein